MFGFTYLEEVCVLLHSGVGNTDHASAVFVCPHQPAPKPSVEQPRPFLWNSLDWLSENAEAGGVDAIGAVLRAFLKPLKRYAHSIIDAPEICYGLSVVMTVSTMRLYDALWEQVAGSKLRDRIHRPCAHRALAPSPAPLVAYASCPSSSSSP